MVVRRYSTVPGSGVLYCKNTKLEFTDNMSTIIKIFIPNQALITFTNQRPVPKKGYDYHGLELITVEFAGELEHL